MKEKASWKAEGGKTIQEIKPARPDQGGRHRKLRGRHVLRPSGPRRDPAQCHQQAECGMAEDCGDARHPGEDEERRFRDARQQPRSVCRPAQNGDRPLGQGHKGSENEHRLACYRSGILLRPVVMRFKEASADRTPFPRRTWHQVTTTARYTKSDNPRTIVTA
jgi:hypothetical protein